MKTVSHERSKHRNPLKKPPRREAVSSIRQDSGIAPHRKFSGPRPRSGRKGLSKSAINFIVDVALLVSFLAVLWTTSVVQFVFPPGTQAVGRALWGFGYDAWCRFQTGTIAVFSLLVLLHLILHWQWICAFVTSRLSKFTGKRIMMGESSKTLYGVGALILVLTILGGLILLAEFQIDAAKF